MESGPLIALLSSSNRFFNPDNLVISMEMDLTGTTVPARIRQMSREEADIAIEWANQEGWNPGLHDADAFYKTDPGGFFSIESGGKMIGSVSLVRYDENFMFGYPQEIQDFMEAIATGREPKAGLLVASDTIAVLYAAYVSAEQKGGEVEVPLNPALGT